MITVLIQMLNFIVRMKQLLIFLALTPFISGEIIQEDRTARNLSGFNVVSFPNSVCGATREVVNTD